MTESDVRRLTESGRQLYDAVDKELRAEAACSWWWSESDCHRAALLAVKAVADLLRQARDEVVAKQLADGPREAVAEDLFDAAHENCDEGCVGGGRPFYDAPARRLTDPSSAVSAFAVEQQMIRQDLDCSPDVAEALVVWAPTLRLRLDEIGAACGYEAIRSQVVNLGGWAAEWVEHLDREEAARIQALAGTTEPEPSQRRAE